ncbi:hypothetical protein [Enterococcus avium]|nr:hypothetical protein [Enterococcus avium]
MKMTLTNLVINVGILFATAHSLKAGLAVVATLFIIELIYDRKKRYLT